VYGLVLDSIDPDPDAAEPLPSAVESKAAGAAGSAGAMDVDAPAAAVKSEAARISRVRYVYLMHTLHHSFIQIGWALP